MMAWWDNAPSRSPGAAGWWGGQGFGGFGSPGAAPPQPVTAPQQGAPAATGSMVGPSIANLWGGQGVGGPGQQWGTAPGASFTSPVQGQDLWSRLMNMVGTNPPRMPGTTVGAPAGQTPMLPPAAPPIFPPGQAPPTMGAYFRAQQFPQGAGGGGNPNLMMQYLALQQLMRGS